MGKATGVGHSGMGMALPKGGGANATSWKKGQSGSSQRPSQMLTYKHVRELARQWTEEALHVLVGIMRDPEATHSVRGAAANALLDRGWGRAPVSVSDADGEPLLAPDVDRNELARRIAFALSLAQQRGREVIDASGDDGEQGGDIVAEKRPKKRTQG